MHIQKKPEKFEFTLIKIFAYESELNNFLINKPI
jgi:hypothetical protein